MRVDKACRLPPLLTQTHMLHELADYKAHYLYARIRCKRLLTVSVTYESTDMLLGKVRLPATNAKRDKVRFGKLLCLIVRLRTRRTAEANSMPLVNSIKLLLMYLVTKRDQWMSQAVP
ncbi:hypothetical protein [Diadegma fenestrale ichnovirus]|nr:hypothetical protein [Diadegma fenestrale ichnovirus]